MSDNKKEFQDIFFREEYFKDINFFNIGHERCLPDHKFGPGLREFYILHLIVAGSGAYRVNQVTYQLSAGDFFILKPNDVVEYSADTKTPWEYFWLGFTGAEAEKLLMLNGITPSEYIGKVDNYLEISQKFAELITSELFDLTQRMALQGAFLELLSHFKIDSSYHKKASNHSKAGKYNDSFRLYVENNYYRTDLTIKEIAKSMFLNSSYFGQAIKEELGMTPQEYLLNYRMTKASLLLKSTELSVDELAYAVGYENRHSFTRAFKRFFGKSPKKYEQKHI